MFKKIMVQGGAILAASAAALWAVGKLEKSVTGSEKEEQKIMIAKGEED